MKNGYYPLTLQNAEVSKKTKKAKDISAIKIDKLQTTKVYPYGLYKPISKLL